jgi:hypothetical protein
MKRKGKDLEELLSDISRFYFAPESGGLPQEQEEDRSRKDRE